MSAAVIALGSNLGDRAGNLRAGLGLLQAAGVRVLRTSSAWETPPVPAGQPSFLNACAVIETSLPPRDLLALLKDSERQLGRRPARHWGPRPLDLDVLFYDDLVLGSPELTIPHPRLSERAFVLAPLSEVVRGPLPATGDRALVLLARLPDAHDPVRTSWPLRP